MPFCHIVLKEICQFALSRKRKPRNDRGNLRLDLFLVFLFGDVKDFLASVIAALGANAMGADHLAAMRASDQTSHFKLEMGTTKSLPRLGNTSLRYCHVHSLLSWNGGIKLAWKTTVNQKS